MQQLIGGWRWLRMPASGRAHGFMYALAAVVLVIKLNEPSTWQMIDYLLARKTLVVDLRRQADGHYGGFTLKQQGER